MPGGNLLAARWIHVCNMEPDMRVLLLRETRSRWLAGVTFPGAFVLVMAYRRIHRRSQAGYQLSTTRSSKVRDRSWCNFVQYTAMHSL